MAERTHEGWAEVVADKRGKDYWRSLEELLDTPDFREAAAAEFPEGKVAPVEGLSRRSFVQLLGASMALAGASACTDRPRQKILPYTEQPADVVPGRSIYYATSMAIDGHAVGLLAKSYAGRPVKIEGNPEHPASLGATGALEQAAILELYDPGRARQVRRGDLPSSWATFLESFGARRQDGGAGVRFLLQPSSSPLLSWVIERLRQTLPGARFAFHAPLAHRGPADGTRALYGRPLATGRDLSRADVILALDADFLSDMPMSLRYARQFADRRRLETPDGAMNRLWSVEAAPSPTGSLADHRLRRRSSEIAGVAAAILAEVVARRGDAAGLPPDATATLLSLRSGPDAGFAAQVADDLVAAAGRALVIAGDRQPGAVHVIAHAIDEALGNRAARWLTEPTLIDAGTATDDLVTLARDLREGRVDTLFVLEGNPSYDAPADLDLSRLVRAVPNTAYLGLYENETARDCRWFLPAAHTLESWGDARAYDGTVSFIQPLIRPMYDGRTPAELLALLAEPLHPARDGHALLRESWQARRPGADLAVFLDAAIQRGFVAGSEAPRVDAPPVWSALLPAVRAAITEPPAGGLEVSLVRSASVYDGRFANNAWLQELPDPRTKLTWDNALLVSPRTAVGLGVTSEDLVDITAGGRTVRAPILVVPGHADGCGSLALGYGRQGAEATARGVGVSAYPLYTTATPAWVAGAEVRRAGGRHRLATTQKHFALHGRPIALQVTLDELRADAGFAGDLRGPVPSLLPDVPQTGDQWAMSIDLSLCTGCSACVVACQSENNTAVVGKSGVLRGREMHWLRIDSYHTGDVEDPRVVNQPMACQHCEKAPCEYVCPVNATVHSSDGLNEMVYNRCVGTRFCSNNCPYKVRRFNFFDYAEGSAPTLQLARNPDVSVRDRGVMEKCTYCVQRIRASSRQAEIEGRPLADGELRTACQQVCPTRAITFGSIADPASEVNRWRGRRQSYEVLHDQGTRPRTQYLAKVLNLRQGVK